MEIKELLSPEAVVPHLKATSKKQLLHDLAARAAQLSGLSERRIYDTLNERERLGSTGMGQGIAIPHGRFPGIDRIVGMFARLDAPIDYAATDDQPVDLVFLLLAPEGAGADHLKALARVARLFREPGVAAKLRASADKSALFAVLIEGATPNAA